MRNSSTVYTAILSTVHGHGYGAETVLENLLRSWPDVGELVLIAPPGSGAAAVAASVGIRFIPLDTQRDAILGNYLAVSRLSSMMPDVGLIHAWHSRGFELALYLGMRLGCPATGTMHDHPKASFHSPARRWLIRFCAGLFSGLVVVSRSLGDACRHAGIQAPTSIIPNGLVDVPVPVHGTGKTAHHVGFLGMASPAKGFRIIRHWIDATADLGWHWNLYGEVHQELKDEAAELAGKSGGRVTLKGYVNTTDIFADLDLLVHASTEFESFGMVLAEAARVGIPAVASNIGGTSEVVNDGVTGYLFDPAVPDAGLKRLRQLMSDDYLRGRMGSSGRSHFENCLKAERMAGLYSEFWRKIMTSRG